MSSSQLNKLKLGTTNGTEVALKISSNVVGDFNGDKDNFLHNLVLTHTRVSKLCKAFANGSSSSTKLLKSQLHKIGQGF